MMNGPCRTLYCLRFEVASRELDGFSELGRFKPMYDSATTAARKPIHQDNRIAINGSCRLLRTIAAHILGSRRRPSSTGTKTIQLSRRLRRRVAINVQVSALSKPG